MERDLLGAGDPEALALLDGAHEGRSLDEGLVMPTFPADLSATSYEDLKAYFDLFGLTDFLYQRDREIIAFARPDLVASGTGSSSVAPVADIRAMNAV